MVNFAYRQLRLVLSNEDKENYIEHPIPDAPVAQPGHQVPPEALAAHAAWIKGQKEVDELLQTVREFHTYKQEEGQSVSSHVLKIKGYIDNLERLGQPVGQNLAVSLILVSLIKDFDSFMQNYNMHGMGKTVNELHAMLKLHEETLPKKDANPALHAIRVGRVQKNQKNKPYKAAKGVMGLRGSKKLKPGPQGHAVPDQLCLYIDAEEYELGDLVELPPNARTIGSKCLFKKKANIDGALYVFKARLADTRAIRILIAIAAYYDYEIWQIDIKIDFLNGHLFEEVYMEQPEGFVNLKYPNHNMTSRFQQNLGEEHWTAVKNILECLRKTKDMFLVYGGNIERELRISCYTDVGYLTDADNLKSQTGYAFVLNRGAIDWNSKKQSIFATSSIFGLGIVPTIKEPISMYCENTKAIKIARDDGVTKCARHFYAKAYYLRLTIKLGDVKIEKIDTDDNLADPFTKALAFPKHSKLTRNIRLVPASSF
nr:hypothetical protein [Tanacetum cinerariifolium]